MFPSQLLRISLRRTPHLNIPKRLAKQLPLEKKLFKTRTRLLAHALSQGVLPRSKLLQQVLQLRKIDEEIFEIWVDILRKGDLVTGLERLGLLESGGEGRIRLECPNWLFLTLPGLLKAGQSQYLISILLSPRFDQLAVDEQSLFIARALQHLLKIKDYVAVRELIEWICWYENEIISSQAFERFLVALTSFRGRANLISSPSQDLLHPLAQMLRETMQERKVKPTSNMFWSLFHPALVPHDSEKAYALLVEMRSLGMPLEKGILESMLRIFAKNNQPVLAGEILGMLDNSIDLKAKAERARSAAFEEIKRKRELRKAMGKYEGLRVDHALALANRLERVRLEEETIKEILTEEIPPTLLSAGQKKKLKAKARKDNLILEDIHIPPLSIIPTIISTVTDSPSFIKPRPKLIPEFVPLDLPPTLPNISNLKQATIFLGSLKTDPTAAFNYFDELRATATQLDLPNWSTLLQIAATTPSISTESLLGLFREIQNSRTGKSGTVSGRLIRGTTRKYTIVLRGLLLRGEFEETMNLWKECLERRDVRPDALLVNVILEAFILGGNLKGGESLINYFTILPTESRLRRFEGNLLHRYAKPHSIALDITVLNTLLSAYNRAGRYTKVYELFKSLESDYGLVPDAATLSILLDTARYASAAAGSGWGPGDQMISFQGDEGNGRDTNDSWDGRPACEVAEMIMWETLATAWPEVEKNLIDPGKEAIGAGFLKWWKGKERSLELVEGGIERKKGEGKLARTLTGELGRPFSATLSINAPLYPSLYPTPRLFNSFIQLLGFHSTSDSISIVLAWMRAIGSKPERKTVLLALLYLGEGGFGERKRERIRAWLIDWLGEEIPSELEVAKARRGSRSRRY